MARDVVSYVSLNTKPRTQDSYGILLISTDGPRDAKVYRLSELDAIREDFPDTGDKPHKIYRKASQFFNQGKTTFAQRLFGKIKIVGIEKPQDPAGLLDAIESYRMNDDEFYMILTDLDEDAYVNALMAYAESTEPSFAELVSGMEDQRKFYFGQTNKKIFVHEKNARSAISYTDNLEEEIDAAYLGNVGPSYPLRMTWKFKKPEGVSVADLSEAEKDNLDENFINYMAREYTKFEYMKQGVCTDGEFIDVQIGADYLAMKIRERVYEILTTTADVPYNNAGFALICSGVEDALQTGISNNIVDRDPESLEGLFFVVRPVLADASEEERRKRLMPVIEWEAQIQGSVHMVIVRGALTVSLELPQAA